MKHFQLTVDPDLHRKFKTKCAVFNISMREVFIKLASAFVDQCRTPAQLEKMFDGGACSSKRN